MAQIDYLFDNSASGNSIFLVASGTSIPYALVVDSAGNIATSLSGTVASMGFLAASGGTITGNLVVTSGAGIFSTLVSGTTISGNSIFQSGIRVLDTVSSSGLGVSLFNSKSSHIF